MIWSLSSTTTSLLVFACVLGAAFFGMWLRRVLPEHHRGDETKDAVKIAMAFVATMSALILGLLVASAKDSYDKESDGVTQMAAKIVFLDRLLANYGPETKEVRDLYRHVVEQVTERMWPDQHSGKSRLDPSATRTEGLFAAIQSLTPKNDFQKSLKEQATSLSLELGQMRWLEYEQSETAASRALLCILVFWMIVLFTSFGMFAPGNATVVVALQLAALSVAGAIFLILELRSPFSGFMQISNLPFLDAIAHLGK